MIPKKIHYCWFGKNPLPRSVKKCIASWRKFCPDYQIIEWNESNFDVNSHPFIKSAYDNKAWAFVSDYARLKIVYDNGGIYFDTDVELLKNIDHLLENNFYIGVQQSGLLCTTGLGFGAERENDYVCSMLKKYDELVYTEAGKREIACPRLNMKVFEEAGYKFIDEALNFKGALILPPRYLDPIAPGNSKNLLCEDTISIHHYTASWRPKLERYKRKIILLIGQERINRIKKYIKNDI